MAIYNRKIQDMTIRAMGMASTDGQRVGCISMQINSGANDAGNLTVKVKQTGAIIRTYWFHDGCRIAKHVAVRIMRQHEEVTRAALNPNPEAESHE